MIARIKRGLDVVRELLWPSPWDPKPHYWHEPHRAGGGFECMYCHVRLDIGRNADGSPVFDGEQLSEECPKRVQLERRSK